jgi:hypothetical protein
VPLLSPTNRSRVPKFEKSPNTIAIIGPPFVSTTVSSCLFQQRVEKRKKRRRKRVVREFSLLRVAKENLLRSEDVHFSIFGANNNPSLSGAEQGPREESGE